MKYQELINKNIKKLRQNHNLTQEEFAQKIDISIQGLSNIERNRYQPSAETIDKICKTFKLSAYELLLEGKDDTDNILNEINAVLSQCTKAKLKKIQKVINLLIKF